MDSTASENGKRHILIVEDNVDLAESFKLLLEQHDFTVSLANNGVIGLKHILHDTLDAVICDLKMPLLEGDMLYDTVEGAMPGLCNRFIILTGHAESEKYERFLRRPGVRVLRKPVTSKQVLEALGEVLAAET